MPEIDALRQRLDSINGVLSGMSLGDPRSMEKVAEALVHKHGQGKVPDQERVVRALREFLATGLLPKYCDVRAACYGLLLPLQPGYTVAHEYSRIAALLDSVNKLSASPKKLLRCFQGLLGAYLSMDGYDSASPFHAQWRLLQNSLREWLTRLSALTYQPNWLQVIQDHSNLLWQEPTERYGLSLLQGRREIFETLCDDLSISPDSWVRRRAVLSAIDAAVSMEDQKFVSHIEVIIGVLKKQEVLESEGVAKLLNRYAVSHSTPEVTSLRKFAVDLFGNPLLNSNRHRWASVSSDAREMVAGWLKGFLIERFFEVLSKDGVSDKRRPKFWLKYRASIENMWFVLGGHSLHSNSVDSKQLRMDMGNNCLALLGSTQSNNAFVMKVGRAYVVEFGETGNATYVYPGDALPFSLDQQSLVLTAMKNRTKGDYLTHMDGHESWEAKFAASLARHGILPDIVRPSANGFASNPLGRDSTVAETEKALVQRIKQFCVIRGLRLSDRESSGVLVVTPGATSPAVSDQLRDFGFILNNGRWERTL